VQHKLVDTNQSSHVDRDMIHTTNASTFLKLVTTVVKSMLVMLQGSHIHKLLGHGTRVFALVENMVFNDGLFNQFVQSRAIVD
jgi:hypothetical protein